MLRRGGTQAGNDSELDFITVFPADFSKDDDFLDNTREQKRERGKCHVFYIITVI